MSDARADDATRADDDLSRDLADALRDVPGVVDVFDARPLVRAAVRVLAAELAPDEEAAAGRAALVLVERSGQRVTITAHVATDLAASTPEVLARAAAGLRSAVAARERGHAPDAEVVVRVRSRLIEPAAAPA
ncbi:hypothetical protein [Frigoribacterium salinisoli]